MQSYAPINPNDTVTDGPAVINQNDQSIMSCSSGTAFPTTNLQVGMLCFRTDQNKLFQLVNLTPTWLMLLDCSTASQATAQNAYGLLSGGASWQPQSGSGPAFGTALPIVNGSGSTDIGLTLDFHTVANDTVDFAVRLTGATGALTCSGNYVVQGKLLAVDTTPYAWGTSYAALDLGNTVSLCEQFASGGVVLGCNTYNDGSNWRAKLGAIPAAIFEIEGNGGFGWFTMPTVAAGAAQALSPTMTLDSNGNLVAYGSITAEQPFILAGTGYQMGSGVNAGFYYDTVNIALRLHTDVNAASTFYIQNYGGVSTIASFSTSAISLNEPVSMPYFTVTSDRRLKSDIEPLTGTGELIDAVETYTYAKGGVRQWGVIAQELQEVAPELVRVGPSEGGFLEVDYNSLFVAMLGEVRSLRARVATLEAAR